MPGITLSLCDMIDTLKIIRYNWHSILMNYYFTTNIDLLKWLIQGDQRMYTKCKKSIRKDFWKKNYLIHKYILNYIKHTLLNIWPMLENEGKTCMKITCRKS